jgi:hypothetical protein
LAGLAAGTPAASAEGPIAGLIEAKVAIARDFQPVIAACVQRHDTDHPIFHGCIDWHSAVHGHWALAAIARATGDVALLGRLAARLSPEAIAAERAFLSRHPDFEMPYGRAWFLRLAIEFGTAADRRLDAMADEVAASLVAYMETRGFDPLIGSYESQTWALINLRAYGIYRGDGDLVAFVDDMVARSRPAIAPCSFGQDALEASFMAICTNWAWLAGESLGGAAGVDAVRRILPPESAMPPIKKPGIAHLYGLDFSRAWGLIHLWRLTRDEAYLRAYGQHFSIGYGNRDWWAGDYRQVAHWVAQFGTFALMPLFTPDRP